MSYNLWPLWLSLILYLSLSLKKNSVISSMKHHENGQGNASLFGTHSESIKHIYKFSQTIGISWKLLKSLQWWTVYFFRDENWSWKDSDDRNLEIDSNVYSRTWLRIQLSRFHTIGSFIWSEISILKKRKMNINNSNLIHPSVTLLQNGNIANNKAGLQCYLGCEKSVIVRIRWFISNGPYESYDMDHNVPNITWYF